MRQVVTVDSQQRAKIVRDFEPHAITQAYTVPLLWWNRIVATSAGAQALGHQAEPLLLHWPEFDDVWLEH